jgi:hypothetical protein
MATETGLHQLPEPTGLSLAQVEHIMLEAMESPGPPQWPDWREE